jgi:hypothetical protein
MPAIITGHKHPKLASVQCSRLKFDPGDRILVKVYRPISNEQRKRLERAVEKWAGVAVRVLIINGAEMDLEIERAIQLP